MILINSFFIVALTEMGDKTQLLALVLATRFKKPWAVMAGILVATVFNHFFASSVGQWISNQLSPVHLKWALALTFFAFALWVLKADKDEELKSKNRWGAFMTTAVLFFLAEMGDKTQLSTVALAAHYNNFLLVTAGTTCGMLAADGMAVVFGEKLTQLIPMKWIHWGASLMFLLFGGLILFH